MAFCNGQSNVVGMVIPVWLMLLCSVVMGVGTSVGGEKIIKSVGMDMVTTGKIPGILRRSCGSDLPAAFQRLWYSGFNNPYQDKRRLWV